MKLVASYGSMLVFILCCETYNIHDSQDVLLDVPATVVTHHHLVSHHQRLHVPLLTDRALEGQLATADVERRGLQSPLPPRGPFHWFFI